MVICQLFSGLALPLAHSSGLSRLGITSCNHVLLDFFIFCFISEILKQNGSEAVMRVLYFRVVGVLSGLWISWCEAMPRH